MLLRRRLALLALLTGCPAPTPTSAQPDVARPNDASADEREAPAQGPPPEGKDDPRPRADDEGDGVWQQLEDGSFTFAGIRDRIAATRKNPSVLEQREYMLHAWVRSVHAAPPCPVEPGCPADAVPHAWVTDSDDADASPMKLVDYSFAIPKRDAKMWKGQPAIALEVGQRYTFVVELRPAGDAGRMPDDAVLHFRRYRPADRPDGWTYPPGAPWHPVALMAEAEKDAERSR